MTPDVSTDSLGLVSIVIPAYNEENAITETIEQVREVMSASQYDYELIIVNDGSTDQTGEKARQAGARVLNHEVNQGYGAGLKTGIVAAKGDWIVITDADGNYTFTVLPGDYTVDVTDGQIAQDYNGAQSVSIGADSNYASVENVDFVYQLPTISGNVYFDITGDLLLSSDEPCIQGVTMTLSDGQTVITDADGNYTFTVLPGDYTVSVGDVQGMDLVTAPSIDVSINADTQYASVAGVDFGLALNIADFCGQLADGFAIGFWKNNVSKAIAGRNKGVQVDAATINSYVDMIADYALEPFDGIDEQGAVDVLSSKSSDAADLLAKQLMGSEFNLMNGAYIGGNELVTEMFINYGEYLLKHAGDYSRDELLDAKDWFDAYNNSHGGAIAGPDCQ